MSKRRLIPKLQLKRSPTMPGRMVLVTTVGFDRVIEVGDPVSQAKIYEAQAADELIIVDLDASKEKRKTDVDVIRKAAEQIFMPFTVGGGVRTIEDVRTLLKSGADKVSINTAAVNHPEFVKAASDKFGASTVVVSIDFKAVGDKRLVYINNGSTQTSLNVVDWAVQAEKLGAGEILLTSIDRDGGRSGLDLEVTCKVVRAVGIPVITSGGCGLASHFVDGFLKGEASAVSAGTYFSFKDENLMQVRSQIKNAGVPIRLLR